MAAARPVAIVTGAYGGMGRACARQLGHRLDLALCDIDAGRLTTLADTLREEGFTVAAAVPGDLSEPGVAEKLVSAARAAGRVAAVAHTAGVSPALGPWDLILRANLVGTERLLLALEAGLEPGLAVVMIASVAGHFAARLPEIDVIAAEPLSPDFLQRMKPHLDALTTPEEQFGTSGPAYGQSKRAVIRICEARAAAWAVKGARIITISPGLMWTPMGRAEAEGNPAAARLGANTPLGRWGTALDIADAVDFLTSDRATFISGADVRIDGAVTPAVRGVTF
jgi:NAD(P)-dependent dehydrogenase (short-subunit alcohol dehydrogenase family)